MQAKIQPTRYLRIIGSLLILSIISLGAVAVASFVGQDAEGLTTSNHQYSLDTPIVILYDVTDRTANLTATLFYQNLKLIYQNTLMKPVIDSFWLRYYLKVYEQEEVAIIIHVFQSTLADVDLGYERLSWRDYLSILLATKRIHHILGMGNGQAASKALADLPSRNQHLIRFNEDSDYIDAVLVFIHVIWECSEIFQLMRKKDLRYGLLARDLKYLAVQFFANNFNNILQREYEPVDVLGEEDVAAKEQWLKDRLKNNPPKITAIQGVPEYYKPPVMLEMVEDPSKVGIGELMSTDPSEVSPEAHIISPSLALAGNETGVETKAGVSIGNLMEFTGLQSSIAGVSDPVIVALMTIGNILGIGRDTIRLLLDAMKIVENVTGFHAGGFEKDSDLGQFVSDLKTTFPYSDEFMPFFDMIGGALPKLRSNQNASQQASEWSLESWLWLITGYAENVGGTLSDWLLNSLNATFIDIFNALSSGTDLWGNSSNYGQAMVGDMANLYIQEVSDRLFQSIGLSSAEINASRPLWNATFDLVSRLLAERDHSATSGAGWSFASSAFWTYFVNSTDIANEEAVLDETSALLDYILALSGLSEEPLRILLEDVFTDALPGEFTSDAASFISTIAALISEIDVAIQGKETSVSDFQAMIQFTLANNLPQSRADWTNFITDLILFTTSYYNDAFVITGEFPTVHSLFSQYLDLLETDGVPISQTTRKNWITLANSLIGMLAVTSDKVPLKRMIGGTTTEFSNIVYSNVSTFVQDLCGLLFNSTDFANLTVKEKVTDFADTLLGTLQVLANGKENPLQSIFQILMLSSAYGLIKDHYAADIDISFLKSLTLWLLDFIYQEYSDQTFITPTDNKILELAIFNITAAVNVTYTVTIAQPLLVNLMRTRSILTTGTRWFYTQLMTWQERKVQELTITIIREIYNAIGGGESAAASLVAAAKTKQTLERLGYRERLENDPQFADLKGISVEKNVITVADGEQAKAYAGKPGFSPTADDGTDKKQGGDKGNRSYGQMFKLPFSYEGEYEMGIGKFSAFKVAFELGIDLEVEFDLDEFSIFLGQKILGGSKKFQNMTAEDALGEMVKFLKFTPVFFFSIEVSGFGSGKSKLFAKLLKFAGKFEIGGGAWIRLGFISFGTKKALDVTVSFKVYEFGFKVWLMVGIEITIWDVAGAATGGALAALGKLAKYIGLDLIKVLLYVKLYFEIVIGNPSGPGPLDCVMTFMITFGVKLTIGFDLGIFALEVAGTIEIVFTFIQDFGKGTPIEIWFDLIFRLEFTVTFFFFDIEFEFEWNPFHIRLTPEPTSTDPDNPGAFGPDSDGDGLGDIFESIIPGFNPNAADTDGDGLNDKMEYFFSFTNPAISDTDGDGLNDFQEFIVTKTNPRFEDTDFDGLSDYEEVILYKTSPFEIDTDGDGLDDRFEVKTAWDITTVTPSVHEVWIGGVAYPNRTDPLNPDTDGDGLLDGEEGPRGIWYGAEYLFDAAEDGSRDEPREAADPIIFNQGFTHPLDNDTDDDSYEQQWNGRISPRRRWLRSMGDGDEIFGLWITFINEWGEPYINLTRTNPICPDTDGDTGRPDLDFGLFSDNPANDNVSLYYNYFLNSDGYELALKPPSDPNDGDSDDDGIIDGLEGTLRPDSNHTHYLNPDTDGDGLGDLQELQLGSDPRSEDTDHDLVSDGDEFFLYGTEPFLADTDFDGLTDGEELFFFHSNPRARDSDGDGLTDGAEVLDYGTDPMDEDSDNDGLTDFEEIKIYLTDPRIADMDQDGLLDGEEIHIYRTDPAKWDTDNDSITYLNESGMITFPLSDGDEVNRYFSNPISGDTDYDGLTDGWELYLGSGRIPSYVLEDPIVLDPNNNDSDGDGLLDGNEMVLMNRTSLIYPYIAFYLTYPYDSRPDRFDTDGDGLDDWDEVMVHYSNPSSSHTDNDNLPDGHEVLYHGTDPRHNDTDGDGLLDNEELTQATLLDPMPTAVAAFYSPIYSTNATNSDTDRDRLPDGAEIHFYGNDPLDGDQNNNGIPDGLDNDTDHDLLEDGLEFYGYWYEEGGNVTWILSPTSSTPEGDGGPLNPDSDHDGLADGLEFYGYHTNASNWDTDNDSFGDGFEILLGSDPLTPATDSSEIYKALDNLNRTVILLLPRNAKPVKVNNVPLVAKILGNVTATQVSYRIRSLDPKEEWSGPALFNYNLKHDQWESSRYLRNGLYEVEVTVLDDEGKSDTNFFLLRVGEVPHENILDKIPKPLIPFIIGIFLTCLVYLGVASRQSLIDRLVRRQKDRSPGDSISQQNESGQEDT